MSTAALILAAGKQSRWKMTEPPYYKQLLTVGQETILERVCRQCRKKDTFPAVITQHAEIKKSLSYYLGIPIEVQKRRWTVETLFYTHELWQERTVVLLGDVVYSKATMDRIFAPQDQELKVFGNEHEIYALSFIGQEIYHPTTKQGGLFFVDIQDSLNEAISHAESGVARGGGKLRKFYQAYCGLSMTGNEREGTVLRWVDDYTQDVDNPGDYETLLKKIKDGVLDDLQ